MTAGSGAADIRRRQPAFPVTDVPRTDRYARRKQGDERFGGRGRHAEPISPARRLLDILGWILAAVGLFLALLVVVGLILSARLLEVKDAVDKAQALVTKASDSVSDLDLGELDDMSTELTALMDHAQAEMDDPMWRFAEALPILGPNLVAVRELTLVVEDVSVGTLAPIAAAADGFTIADLKPRDGALPIEPILRIAEVMPAAASAFEAAAKSAEAIDFSWTLPFVSGPGEDAVKMLTELAPVLTGSANVLANASDLLGVDEPRHYLLMFQNLAEATALGGMNSAFVGLDVADGKISFGDVVSAQDFRWQDGSPVLPPEPQLTQLYTNVMYERVNAATSRPDFPTAALISREWWAQRDDRPIDAVISVDPVALGYLLRATGPIALPGDVKLTSKNAVSQLLNQVYLDVGNGTKREVIERINNFFAQTAQRIFQKVLSPSIDIGKLIGAVSQGVRERHILAWSPHDAFQKLFVDGGLDGTLPKTNEEQTTLGVFFRDTSESKMDYYLKSKAKLVADMCSAEPKFTLTTTLTLDIDQATFDSLPIYIYPALGTGAEVRTQAFIYGPVGGWVDSTSIGIQGKTTVAVTTVDDLGRPVQSFEAWLTPGQSTEFTVQMTGPEGEYGMAQILATPMINPTELTVEQRC